MKKMIIALFILPSVAIADTPAVSCPLGYTMISVNNDASKIAETCPLGYSAIAIQSCLTDDFSGGCYMYAPAGVSYTDDIGIYEFTDACPMS
ncbi:MAG: hypothetical protein IJD41_04220 [Alphaproteobacteria bacterium]|nr:hypothetical protein [Alphaproteobacteria bacterium]